MRPPALATALGCLLSGAAAAPLWPKPVNETYPATPPLSIHPDTFRFTSIGADSALLRSAFRRYRRIVFETPPYYVGSLPAGPPTHADGSAGPAPSPVPPPPRPVGSLTELRVFVGSTDQSLGEQTDESYSLAVGADATTGGVGRRGGRGDEVAEIQAASVYGALRGLETFAQLVDRVDDGGGGHTASTAHRHCHHHKRKKKRRGHHHKHHRADRAAFSIRPALIYDEPRFPHRGLLLDTARHFLPVPAILANLDALAASKMNYLHWHLSDDQAFSVALPGTAFAAGAGAVAPGAFYTPADVAAVVSYARARGIRVIPEIDVPSHAASWARAYPADVLTPCLDPTTGAPTGDSGPLNPASNATWDALWAVLSGAARLFPDAAIHLGGDEAALGCWAAHPAVRAWGDARGARTPRAILARFMEGATELAASAGRMVVVWQEVLDAGADLPTGRGGKGRPPATVQVWKWWDDNDGTGRDDDGGRGGRSLALPPADFGSPALGRPATPWERELAAVVDGGAGHRALLSAPWYLNLGARAGSPPDWEAMWAADPTEALLAAGGRGAGLVRGGEAVAWGEALDGTNVLATVWPRAAAVGERLWSPRRRGGPPGGSAPDDDDDDDGLADARVRLAVHRCRLLARGIGAGPVTGAGWCPGDGARAVAGLGGWWEEAPPEEDGGGEGGDGGGGGDAPAATA